MEHESKPLKRVMDTPDGPAKKRAKDYGEAEDRVAFKILIPQMAVGAIIGKGGEQMRALKQEHNCQVSMSKNGEVYPNTNERICLIRGTIANCVGVLRVMGSKIYEKCQDAHEVDQYDFNGVIRGCEMKIVMPNTSAGLVIGKAGSNIKEIRDTHEVNIQVHPKAGTMEAKNSTERVITLSHEDQEKLIAACEAVIHKVAADPHHARDIDRDGDNFAPHGGKMGPPMGRAHSPAFQAFNTPSAPQYGYQNAPYNAGGGQQLMQQQQPPQQQMAPGDKRFTFNPASMSNQELLAFLDQLQSVLRNSGFSEGSISEVMSALQVLAKYNIMALGLGFGVVAMAHLRSNQPQSQQQGGAGGGNPGGVADGVMQQHHGAAGFDGGYPGGMGFPWKR